MYKVNVCLGMMLCIFADIFMNSMSAGYFATGEGWERTLSLAAFIGVAIAFAVNGPLIAFFGDQRAVNTAFAASFLSAVLSMSSVYLVSYSQVRAVDDTLAERGRLEQMLSDRDARVRECRADRYCDSEKMRTEMARYESELAALPKGMVAVDTASWGFKFTLCVKMMVALFLPFIASELSRIYGKLIGRKLGAVVGSGAVSGNSEGSKAVPPVPKLGTLGNSGGSEAVSGAVEGTDRGTTARIPTDAEHQQIRRVYQAMKREGVPVTVESLRVRCKKSKSLVGWWLRNTDEVTRMAGNSGEQGRHGSGVVVPLNSGRGDRERS